MMVVVPMATVLPAQARCHGGFIEAQGGIGGRSASVWYRRPGLAGEKKAQIGLGHLRAERAAVLARSARCARSVQPGWGSAASASDWRGGITSGQPGQHLTR